MVRDNERVTLRPGAARGEFFPRAVTAPGGFCSSHQLLPWQLHITPVFCATSIKIIVSAAGGLPRRNDLHLSHRCNRRRTRRANRRCHRPRKKRATRRRMNLRNCRKIPHCFCLRHLSRSFHPRKCVGLRNPLNARLIRSLIVSKRRNRMPGRRTTSSRMCRGERRCRASPGPSSLRNRSLKCWVRSARAVEPRPARHLEERPNGRDSYPAVPDGGRRSGIRSACCPAHRSAPRAPPGRAARRGP